MRIRTLSVAAAIVLWQFVAVGTAQPPSVPVLVELFTSEGCSTCPVADALLKELVSSQPVKGAMVIGLSEHVDYFNHLGWKDPFSRADFTKRQEAYASVMRTPDVYTPQIVVNGTESAAGNDRKQVMAAIERAISRPSSSVALAWTRSSPLTLDVSLAAGAGRPGKLFVAVAEDGLRSSVKRGENAGRRLEHTNVTRRLTAIGSTAADGSFRAALPIAVESAWNRKALHIVVFVQPETLGAVTAVASIAAPPDLVDALRRIR